VNGAAHIAGFALPLALDTLAVAIALGLRGDVAPLRFALLCAAFEGAMPAIGAGLALVLPPAFTAGAVYAGSAILIVVGIHAFREASEGDETEGLTFASARGMALAGFAISTDELAIGFPLAANGLPILVTLAVIAAQSFLVAFLGVALGRRLGRGAARSAGTAAGVAFVGLGIVLAIERFRA